MENENKITVYLDADDTVLESSKAIIEILNKKYNINPAKTIKNMMDWEYKSIYKYITHSDICKIYESDEFFDIVQINEDFLNFYKESLNIINFVFVTKGTQINIDKKERYLRKLLGNTFQYIGMTFKVDGEGQHICNHNKVSINMRHGIQIDDRIDCLENTNAPIKILMKMYGDRYWNMDYSGIPNLYAVNGWKEAIQIIKFAYNEHYIFKKCN